MIFDDDGDKLCAYEHSLRRLPVNDEFENLDFPYMSHAFIRVAQAILISVSVSLFCVSVRASDEIPQELIGDWSLDMETKEPAWLSIFRRDGKPMVFMRVYIGSDGPYEVRQIKDGRISFSIKPLRKSKSSNAKIDRRVEVSLVAGRLVGVIRFDPSDGGKMGPVHFSGKPIPPMPTTAPDLSRVEFGERIVLFNGKDLTGWRPHEPNKKNGWSAQGGILVNTTPETDFSATGAHANLRTVKEFDDFRLHIEFLLDDNRNSGIYLRGMYEAQVVDRDSRMQGIQGVGAIFGRIAPIKNAGKPGGEWQTYDLTLVKRHITVVLNGETVIDNQPVIGPTAGAIYTDPAAPGPIYLQGDHTSVKYRNIYLEPVVE